MSIFRPDIIFHSNSQFPRILFHTIIQKKPTTNGPKNNGGVFASRMLVVFGRVLTIINVAPTHWASLNLPFGSWITLESGDDFRKCSPKRASTKVPTSRSFLPVVTRFRGVWNISVTFFQGWFLWPPFGGDQVGSRIEETAWCLFILDLRLFDAWKRFHKIWTPKWFCHPMENHPKKSPQRIHPSFALFKSFSGSFSVGGLRREER